MTTLPEKNINKTIGNAVGLYIRTLIYVPQVFASRLRRERIHDQVYSHDQSLWRMVCVGYHAWAWKRMLVKSIFFDALRPRPRIHLEH